jgi:predicted nucleic acid-binding protein
MSAPVFVDTNVLVHGIDARDARKQSLAEEWLAYLWQRGIGRTSVQVLNEYLVTVTRKLRPALTLEQAWPRIRALRAWDPRPTDAATMEHARELVRAHELSWWDALIVAAAQLQGCAVLLSEDFQDGARFGAVTVRSPFVLAVGEPLAGYLPRAALVERPAPRRGRPRKRA